MSKYIVSHDNGNPKILQLNVAGIYETIAFSAGEGNLKAVVALVEHANAEFEKRQYVEEDFKAKKLN